jgi:hypothetical protein
MKPVKKVVEGNDAVLKINMFLPENEPIEQVIRLKNFKGSATSGQRTPKAVVNAIALGLMSKYGKIIK